MALIADDKDGLCRLPSGCADHAAKAVSVNFQDVYEFIILEAIQKANASLAARDLKIECTRGEDLAQGGNIVSQFLQRFAAPKLRSPTSPGSIQTFCSSTAFAYPCGTR